MPFDGVVETAGRARQLRGKTAYHAGLAAEDAVARAYGRHGHDVVARRWRGLSGEVDLVLRDGEGLIFVEVKQSSSHAMAAEHLHDAQVARIIQTGEEFLGTQPLGQATEIRFDLALVDGKGQIEVIENAFAL